MTTGTAVEERVVSWIRTLLAQARRLQDQGDPAWRHAYGLAQGMGLVMKSRAWPPSPTTSGSTLARLIGEETARRERNGAPPPPDDPFGQVEATPVPQAAAGEKSVESLLKSYLALVKAPGRDDPAWRHGFGLAQGFGILRGTAEWPARPDQDGSRFRALLPAGRSSGPTAPAPPRPPAPPAASRAMATVLDGEEDGPASPPTPPIGLIRPPHPPKVPTPPAMRRPPPGDFRAQATMLDPGEEDDKGGFRAQATMLDPAEQEEDKGRFRAQATMLEGEEAAPPVPATPRSLPRPPGPLPVERAAPAPKPSMREALSGTSGRVAAPAADAAAKADLVQRIGKWTVLDRLGKGAMGQVFKARDDAGRVVAIKVLHSRYGKSKRVKARFLREAKAVERIRHESVVQFVESGEEPGVGQYIAMEFVDGEPMHELLRKRRGKPPELSRAIDYIVQLAKGLRAAHAAGVIHRDLKPENVLVTRDHRVKITDFSLARRDQDSMLLTRPGQVMGTPHFMSPEQARGEPIDVRTDLYSLGAMLYVLLTGQFPFPLASVAEVIQAHCEQPRPDPRQQNPDCPEALASIAMRLMAIDRAERPASVEAVLEELLPAVGLDPAAAKEEEQPEIVGALPPGTRVASYSIERVIGAGGMGAVYQAREGENLVALKVLPAEPGRDPAERVRDVRRFHNEAKLARRIVSPYTYRILGHGTDPDTGQAWMAASLVKGTSLRDLVTRKGPLPPEALLKIARGVLMALHDVHGANVIHRDVTPANILLPDDFAARKDAGAVLIDFGLAIPADAARKRGPAWGNRETSALFKHRVGAASSGSHVALSASSSGLGDVDDDELFVEDLPGGTPAYMAPEVLEEPLGVDGRCDLYSLGASLYHAATGHPPYTGETMEQVLYQQKNERPAPIRQFNADFPEELEQLILSLLADEPDLRPRTAKLCLNKLQRIEDPAAVPNVRPDAAPVAAAPQVVVRREGGATNFVIGFAAGTLFGGGGLFVLYFTGLLPKL